MYPRYQNPCYVSAAKIFVTHRGKIVYGGKGVIYNLYPRYKNPCYVSAAKISVTHEVKVWGKMGSGHEKEPSIFPLFTTFSQS